MATIVCPRHRPQMATVRPGVFAAPAPDPSRAGEVVDVELDCGVEPRMRVLSVAGSAAGDSIATAEVLVVAGRGIGSKKRLPLVRELAEALGAQVGCTRPLVEAGWLEGWQQVGQTGVSVAPRVLLSLGVSGAIQHVAGISGAQTVIAVNDDPAAPIFASAQYKVVGDCVVVCRGAAGAPARIGSPRLKKGTGTELRSRRDSTFLRCGSEVSGTRRRARPQWHGRIAEAGARPSSAGAVSCRGAKT